MQFMLLKKKLHPAGCDQFGRTKRNREWFVFLATPTGKTNCAVVEQHGFVQHPQSSRGFAVFDQNLKFEKMVLRRDKQEQENGSDLWQCAFVNKTGLYNSSMDFLGTWRVAAKLVSCGSFCWLKTAPNMMGLWANQEE